MWCVSPLGLALLTLLLATHTCFSFHHPHPNLLSRSTRMISTSRISQPITNFHKSSSMVVWSQEADKETANAVEETVEKYGLEAGMLKAATEKDAKVKPKDLFAKYGIAYLLTSISFAIISYALCYVLIANGVDVPKLLEKIGLESTQMAANTGTAALAYAVHKAASPIRFPPTVALTPVVARWLGKRDAKKEEQNTASESSSKKQ